MKRSVDQLAIDSRKGFGWNRQRITKRLAGFIKGVVIPASTAGSRRLKLHANKIDITKVLPSQFWDTDGKMSPLAHEAFGFEATKSLADRRR